MGAVSSKIPCDRDGQNSIGQTLPETFAYKIWWRVWWKKSPGSLCAFQVIYCLKNRNSIFISTPYPVGIKPYQVGIKTSVHIIYLGKYGWVGHFISRIIWRFSVEKFFFYVSKKHWTSLNGLNAARRIFLIIYFLRDEVTV